MTKRKQVISALVEGNSIRAACRMTGVAKGTVLKLLADVGRACARYQDEQIRDLSCERIQCDEIWAFCYAKDKNLPINLQRKAGFGSIWTWTALCPDTKLMVSYLVGGRTPQYASKFMDDLASRLSSRIQLTTDGHRVYLEAVEGAFGSEINYSMLVKLYSNPPTEEQARYSPARCCGTRRAKIIGNPDSAHVSTSHVERANLTMRMHMRRFTRLTNAFSKKVANLEHSVALHFMYYNFGKVHQTLRVTPAMEAGLSDHVWSLGEIADLSD